MKPGASSPEGRGDDGALQQDPDARRSGGVRRGASGWGAGPGGGGRGGGGGFDALLPAPARRRVRRRVAGGRGGELGVGVRAAGGGEGPGGSEEAAAALRGGASGGLSRGAGELLP